MIMFIRLDWTTSYKIRRYWSQLWHWPNATKNIKKQAPTSVLVKQVTQWETEPSWQQLAILRFDLCPIKTLKYWAPIQHITCCQVNGLLTTADWVIQCLGAYIELSSSLLHQLFVCTRGYIYSTHVHISVLYLYIDSFMVCHYAYTINAPVSCHSEWSSTWQSEVIKHSKVWTCTDGWQF